MKAFLILLIFCAGCGSGLRLASKPTLYNLVVDIQTCATPCGAGSFYFIGANDETLVFGSTSGSKIIPNIEFRVTIGSDVMSPVLGTVSEVEKNDDYDDYAIRIVPGVFTSYVVEIDHVRDVTVSAGGTVRPGQKLGTAGAWSATQGRVELQVSGNSKFFCPMDFLHPSVKSTMTAKMSQLQADWEAVKANPGLYNEVTQYSAGCVTSEIES